MKKNIIFAAFVAAAALLVSTSCTKQDVDLPAVSGAKVFTASIAQVQTKTSLGTYEGYDNVLFWDKRDSILINKETFYSAEPNSERPGKAEFLHCGGPEPKAPYEAIFPASLYVDEWYMQGYCFPQVQEYRAGKFNAPMYAYSEVNRLLFNNICGVIRFSLKGTEKIQSIELTSKEKYINGAFKVVKEGEDDYKAEIDNTAGDFYDYNRIVTLSCGNGVQLSKEDSTDFFIYLPETSFAAGDLSVRVTTADGKSFEKTASNPVTVEKNTVYTFNWEVDATLLHTLATFFRGLSEDQARLAAATDEAMRFKSQDEVDVATPKDIFLPKIHTWENARPAILAIEESLAKIDNNVVNLMGLTRPELMFLKAYLYFELARTYGQAPPILSLPGEKDHLTEFMEFIVNNAGGAIDSGLPVEYSDPDKKTIELAEGIEMTRPTKCAALALMARASLYFASPLFSNNSDYDQDKLKMTKEFCKNVMASGRFELESEYSNLWNMNSKELIFGVSFNQGSDVYAGIHPTQSIVDKYWGLDGTECQTDEPIVFGNAFAIRDNRCSFTIGIPTTTDGYTLIKPMSTFLPIFHFAGIKLDYAEVCLKTHDEGECIATINEIRAKHSNIAAYTPPGDLQQAVERERLVDLAFEGHRFWDVRRWRKGGECFGMIFAADVHDGGSGLVATRVQIYLPWSDEFNFYPTPW